MTQFILAFLFGVGQILLTERLICAIRRKDGKKICLFFIVKFVAYVIGIGAVVIKNIWRIGMFLSGFVAAVPITAIALYVYRTILKGNVDFEKMVDTTREKLEILIPKIESLAKFLYSKTKELYGHIKEKYFKKQDKN